MARQLTITLDDETAERLEAEAQRTGASFDEIANGAMRRGLGTDSRRTFEVRPFNLGKPTVSLDCVAEALEAEDAAEKRVTR